MTRTRFFIILCFVGFLASTSGNLLWAYPNGTSPCEAALIPEGEPLGFTHFLRRAKLLFSQEQNYQAPAVLIVKIPRGRGTDSSPYFIAMDPEWVRTATIDQIFSVYQKLAQVSHGKTFNEETKRVLEKSKRDEERANGLRVLPYTQLQTSVAYDAFDEVVQDKTPSLLMGKLSEGGGPLAWLFPVSEKLIQQSPVLGESPQVGDGIRAVSVSDMLLRKSKVFVHLGTEAFLPNQPVFVIKRSTNPILVAMDPEFIRSRPVATLLENFRIATHQPEAEFSSTELDFMSAFKAGHAPLTSYRPYRALDPKYGIQTIRRAESSAVPTIITGPQRTGVAPLLVLFPFKRVATPSDAAVPNSQDSVTDNGAVLAERLEDSPVGAPASVADKDTVWNDQFLDDLTLYDSVIQGGLLLKDVPDKFFLSRLYNNLDIPENALSARELVDVSAYRDSYDDLEVREKKNGKKLDPLLSKILRKLETESDNDVSRSELMQATLLSFIRDPQVKQAVSDQVKIVRSFWHDFSRGRRSHAELEVLAEQLTAYFKNTAQPELMYSESKHLFKLVGTSSSGERRLLFYRAKYGKIILVRFAPRENAYGAEQVRTVEERLKTAKAEFPDIF